MSRALVRGTAVLLTVASLLGLTLGGAHGDVTSTAAMLRGYDVVGLLLVVPLLVGGSRRSASARARLVLLGALAYTIYATAFAVLGSGWTGVLLLQAMLLVTAGWAFGAALVETGPVGTETGRSRSWAAAGLAVLGLALLGMWSVAAVGAAVDGTRPAGSALVETDEVVRLGVVLDLVLLVPLYLVAAWLLHRRRRWGVTLGAVALVSGLVHQVAYLVALPVQVWSDVAGARWTDPAEPLVVVVYAAGCWLLLRPVRDIATGAVRRSGAAAA